MKRACSGNTDSKRQKPSPETLPVFLLQTVFPNGETYIYRSKKNTPLPESLVLAMEVPSDGCSEEEDYDKEHGKSPFKVIDEAVGTVFDRLMNETGVLELRKPNSGVYLQKIYDD